MDDGTEFWFWAGPDGSLKTVDEAELKSGLSRGQIPPKAFVWRTGWGEWLRAAQVAELSLSIPAGQRAPAVAPTLGSQLTHPPPVPADVKGIALAPIVPVASTPENDRPGTQLLDEIEISVTEVEPVKPPAAAQPPKSAPPPPSRRQSAPPPSGSAPPAKSWIEVKADAPLAAVDDAPVSDRTETSLEPIVPVDSAPNHEPITGMIGDEEIQIIEASAGETVKKAAAPTPAKEEPKPAKEAPKAAEPEPKLAKQEAPAPQSVPSLDKLAASIEAKKAPRPSPVIAVGPKAIPPAAKLAPMPAAAVVVAGTPPPPAVAPPRIASAPAPVPVAVAAAPVPVAVAPAPVPVAVAPAPVPVAVAAAPVPVAVAAAPVVRSAPIVAPDAIIPVSEPEHDAPTQVLASALPLQEPNAAEPLPSWEVEEPPAHLPPPPRMPAGPSAAPAASPSYAPPAYASYAPPKKKSALPLVIGGLGVVGLFGVAALGALLYFKPWKSAPDEATPAKSAAVAAASSPTATTPTLTGCVVSKDAKRLAPAIALSVPPYVAPLGSDKIAVGFASSATTAVGLELDAQTLDVHEVMSSGGAKVVGVVPVNGKAGFAVDREGGKLGLPHTIDSDAPFVIGFGPTGYARESKQGGLDVIWSGVGNVKATEARVASVNGAGHAVTFRTGGQVRVGWLKSNGDKSTDLGAVDGEGSRVGNPTVAANDEGILVAFAAKSSEGGWSVQLSSAKPGDTPTKSVRFQPPAGGPGGDVIAPVAAGLSGGRWLLQWTEGGAGERVVRAQTLDSKLAPVGEALRVSAAGKEAGQGVVAVNGDRAVSLQLVKGDQGYELWGTALGCK